MWSNELDGTIGIDLFIGEEDYIGRGYGTMMMEQFLCKLFSDDKIIKVTTDVNKNNHRAIRCYEKLGFYLSHEEQTPDGVMLIMNRYRNTNIETHGYILKKPKKETSLYKIISSKNFFDMIQNNYLYFKRVDTYLDDTRDSDQPSKDKEASEKSKFENAPDYTLRHYYDSCRSKTYACCFSTENTQYVWDRYGDKDPNSVCLVINSHKFINFLNQFYDKSKLLYGNNQLLKNFFYLNHGIVTYGDFDKVFLKEKYPNPIEYVYFKNAEKYSEENEFRVSLSCLGIYKKYVLPNKNEFTFPDAIPFEFDFAQAIKSNIITQLLISERCNDKNEIITKLNDIMIKKGVTIKFG